MDDRTHFSSPVRFGRRKTDQVGHLVLTSAWLKFHGTVELSIAWSEVSGVETSGDELVVSLLGSGRTLRFWCHGPDEAQRGMAVAAHLTALAQADACHGV